MLMVSATGDWTKETMEREYPAVRSVYELFGAADKVQAVRMTAEHNYNKDSREAMYAWMARWFKGGAADAKVSERSFSVEPLQNLLVLHGRSLPSNAATPAQFTEAWIAAAKRQLSSPPSPDMNLALRHAVGDEASFSAGDATPAPTRTVLVSHSNPAVEKALASAGFVVRPIALKPFDAAAAAKVNHFETYNRTLAGQRVADIAAAVHANPGAAIVADGDVALAAILAAAIVPVPVAVLDVGQFDTSSDAAYLERLYIPGLRRAGDLKTAAALTRGKLVIHNAGDRFDIGVDSRPDLLAIADIVKTLKHFGRTRGSR
jgi:hypothetical protein